MKSDDKTPNPPNEPTPPGRRSLAGHVSRAAAWTVVGALTLVLLLVGGFWWYSTTNDFQRRVGSEIVTVLENATGGRVELDHVRFSLWHLAIEVDGLVIHGLEAPNQAPYLAADKIQVRVKVTSFLAHSTGAGVASHVGLSLLRVEHPRMHLIIDKDGKTNQPTPKHPATSSEPLQDTLLDLRANEMDLADGIALVNDRAIPFDMAARDLNAEIHYLSGEDQYQILIDLDDLRTRMKDQPEAHSKLHLEAQLGRDRVELTKFEFDSGKASVLRATGSIHHFAEPEWQLSLDGTLELRQISVLTATEGLTAGTIDLNVKGHSCQVTPVVAQKHPHFWQRKTPAKPAQPGKVPLPPDPSCEAGYLVVGNAKLHNVGYENANVRLRDVQGGADLHITPTELLFTALTGYLPGGGSAAGELRIVNWLGEAPPMDVRRRSPLPPLRR